MLFWWENEADLGIYIILVWNGHASNVRDRWWDYWNFADCRGFDPQLSFVFFLQIGKSSNKKTAAYATVFILTKLSQLYRILSRKHKHITSAGFR